MPSDQNEETVSHQTNAEELQVKHVSGKEEGYRKGIGK